MTSSAPVGKPSLKVPRENNRFLCFPQASDSLQLLDRNRSSLSDPRLPRWFLDLRNLARKQALSAAKNYMVGYAPSLANSISENEIERQAWVVGGHQPELFHSGVWFKNFLMAEIGRRTHSVGFQVIIDHDVARSDALRIPCLSNVQRPDTAPFSLRSLSLPIREESAPRMPWHATRIDRRFSAAWNNTIESVGQSMAECGLAPPLLRTRKRLLEECCQASTNIGDAFSQFRHRIEIDHGVSNMEVPIGHLCDASAFGLFVHHCVSNAQTLWTTYNECRDAYRERHKIRNQGQPVLELQRADHWLELPFWIYRRSGPNVVRNRLWVCHQNDGYLLSDSFDPSKRTLSVSLPLDRGDLPACWSKCVELGICIRPRALMTTMYLRCFLADLFVHGIGGGTYDELTDDILSQWLGLSPPAYLISSASLYLPFPGHPEVQQLDPSLQLASIQRELHLMRSVPERFLDRNDEWQRSLHTALMQQLVSIPQRGRKRDWHQTTAKIKHQIEVAIAPQKRSSHAKLEAVQRALQQVKILNSREYSFVMFDEEDVVGRLQELAESACNQPAEAAIAMVS